MPFVSHLNLLLHTNDCIMGWRFSNRGARGWGFAMHTWLVASVVSNAFLSSSYAHLCFPV